MQTQNPNASRVVTLLATAAAIALACAYAFYFVFSRSMSLDEGYLMITVQSFNAGHALYDNVFTQYGPFYYFYEWLLRSALGIPLTHDATRFLTMAHWLVAALLLGSSAWRFTRSTLAGLFVGTLSFAHLSTMANEPGHPQELVVVLLALGVLAASYFPERRRIFEALGVVAALLAFTKINVGVFFGFAAVLTLRSFADDRFAKSHWRWLTLGACAVLPWLLVRAHLSAEWCRNFALVASAGTVAAWVACERGEATPLRWDNYLKFGVGFAAVGGLLTAITFGTGTTFQGLLDGLVLTPMKMPKVATLPIDVPAAAVLSAIAALGAALAWKKQVLPPAVVPVLKAAFAIGGAFACFGNAKAQLVFVLPWCWLVAASTNETPQVTRFARVFLVFAAVWQGLQVYPIAGTQVTLGTFLLVLSYGVCIADAMRALTTTKWYQENSANYPPRTRLLVQGFAATFLLVVFSIWCPLKSVQREYASLLPLELPGSRFVRMNEEMTTMNQELARYLAAECDTFVSYPGINSLYFWSGKLPPTQINSTGWGQLSHAQQQQILGALQNARRPKLVVTEAMMRGWETPYADPIRPLVRFVLDDCQPVKRIGRCVIFEPKPATQLSRVQ